MGKWPRVRTIGHSRPSIGRNIDAYRQLALDHPPHRLSVYRGAISASLGGMYSRLELVQPVTQLRDLGRRHRLDDLGGADEGPSALPRDDQALVLELGIGPASPCQVQHQWTPES